MLKSTLIAAIAATAGLVAVTSPAAARCANGYEPVKIQGNWVCRLKTPKLPLKAKTQTKRSHYFIPRLVDKARPN